MSASVIGAMVAVGAFTLGIGLGLSISHIIEQAKRGL